MSFEGINRKESPSRGMGSSKRWLQPGERRSQTRHVGSPEEAKLGNEIGRAHV